LANIVKSGFKGKIFPVNLEAKEIDGLIAYPSIGQLPEVPDLAVIAIPAPLVTNILREIVIKGIKNVVILSAGFKESGPEGEQLEKELVDIANGANLNLLGPNCLGFVNSHPPLNLTFAQADCNPGNIRFITQSGAIAASVFDWCEQNELGFSDFITLGNKSTLGENDILEYWQSENYKNNLPPIVENASLSRPIGLYLESLTKGKDFLDLAKKISKVDPIFILKPGKTKAAARAMQSHTGAITGEDAVFEVACRQVGITRCDGLEDFFDLARAFSWENPPAGSSVAIISNAGGPAVISAEAVENEGLSLASFDEQTERQLVEYLPRTASIINPVDVLGDALAERYANAIKIVLQEPSVHALIVILTPQLMTEIESTSRVIAQASQQFKKPIFCSFIGGHHIAKGEEILNQAKIPSFRYPERAVKVVAAMWRWQKWRSTAAIDTPQPLTTNNPDLESLIFSSSKDSKALSFEEANRTMYLTGLSTPLCQVAKDFESAASFPQATGWPVVLKLSSPAIVHKTDVNGVVTDITNYEALKLAWNSLLENKRALEQQLQTTISIIIQKQITHGVELIVGIKRDLDFGPVLLFGAGGLYAEILSDHNLLLLPATADQIGNFIKSSKVNPMLNGYRSKIPLAVDRLIEMIGKLSRLVYCKPEISEIEINPVVLTETAAFAVDSRVILSPALKLQK